MAKKPTTRKGISTRAAKTPGRDKEQAGRGEPAGARAGKARGRYAHSFEDREDSGARQRGFFVSFGSTRDAEQECAAFYKRTGRIIKLLTVQEILDEEHVQKM